MIKAAILLPALLVLFLVALEANGADRVKAGQWETRMTPPGGQTSVTQHCMTAAETKLLNGDAAALRKHVEQSTATKTRGRCAVRSFELQDNQTIVKIGCGKVEVVTTTTYHGDHYEASSSNGLRLVGKRLGDCAKPLAGSASSP